MVLGEIQSIVKQGKSNPEYAQAKVIQIAQQDADMMRAAQVASEARSFEEELARRRAEGLNDDGSSKHNEPGIFNNNSVVGTIITTLLITGGATVIAGIAAPALFEASAAVAGGGSVLPEAAASLAPLAGTAPPISIAAITETAATAGTALTLGDKLSNAWDSASGAVESVTNSPILDNKLVQQGVAKLISEANAGSLIPQSTSGVMDQVQKQADKVNDELKKISDNPDTEKETDYTWLWVAGGATALLLLAAPVKKKRN